MLFDLLFNSFIIATLLTKRLLANLLSSGSYLELLQVFTIWVYLVPSENVKKY